MKKIFIILFTTCFLFGCNSTHQDVLGTNQSQIQMRNYQSRSYDTTDKIAVLRAVVSTLQDLGFIIERADEKLGAISGTSYVHESKITVSVRSIDKKTIVRANAQVGLTPLENPIPYQNFFNALGQSLFLQANEIE